MLPSAKYIPSTLMVQPAQLRWHYLPSRIKSAMRSALDSMPHQLQEPLPNDRGLEGHLQITCLVGTERGVLVELPDQVGDESLHLGRGKLIGHSARLRCCRVLEATLDCYGEQLVLDGLPLHVAKDVEVFAQVTATEIQDLTFLVCNPVGALRLGDQFMRVEVCLDSFVLRVRVLRAEGEEHRIHEELLGVDLDAHLSPLALHPYLTVSGPSPDAYACLQQALRFRYRLQDLPPFGDPWDKGLTAFCLERGFAQGIVVLHRHEGVGDLPGQRPVGVTVGGKATMTVAGAGPKDAHALRRHQADLVHACQGGAGDRSRVILARHDA